MPSIVIEATWAAAGATVIIYLAALAGRAAGAVRRGRGRRRLDLAEDPARHAAAAAAVILFVTLILQLIATAQLFTEPFLFTGGGPANATMTVLLLIYHYAFQNSLGGDYGMAAALSLMLAAFLGDLHRRLLLADAVAGARPRERRAGPAPRGDAALASRRRRPRDHLGGGLAAAPDPLDVRGAPRRRPCSSCWSSGSGRSCGWSSRRSRRPRTRSATPMALWPHGFDLGQLATAWSRTHIDRYLWNTVVIAFGSWVVQIVVATTAGFALSVLRPRGGRLLTGPRARDAVRAADRAARAALPDDRRRADRPRPADRQRTGRSGCRPARARSTSS